MTLLWKLLQGLLGPLLDYFRQRQGDVDARNQLERVTREAELARAELIKARENLDVAKNREAVDQTVAALSNDDVLERLRNARRGT